MVKTCCITFMPLSFIHFIQEDEGRPGKGKILINTYKLKYNSTQK